MHKNGTKSIQSTHVEQYQFVPKVVLSTSGPTLGMLIVPIGFLCTAPPPQQQKHNTPLDLSSSPSAPNKHTTHIWTTNQAHQPQWLYQWSNFHLTKMATLHFERFPTPWRLLPPILMFPPPTTGGGSLAAGVAPVVAGAVEAEAGAMPERQRQRWRWRQQSSGSGSGGSAAAAAAALRQCSVSSSGSVVAAVAALRQRGISGGGVIGHGLVGGNISH
jgi:hypothetical protein